MLLATWTVGALTYHVFDRYGHAPFAVGASNGQPLYATCGTTQRVTSGAVTLVFVTNNSGRFLVWLLGRPRPDQWHDTLAAAAAAAAPEAPEPLRSQLRTSPVPLFLPPVSARVLTGSPLAVADDDVSYTPVGERLKATREVPVDAPEHLTEEGAEGELIRPAPHAAAAPALDAAGEANVGDTKPPGT